MTVLYFQSSFGEMSARMAAGARCEADRQRWSFRIVPYGNAVPRDMSDHVDICTRHTLASLLANLRPNGCIVEYSTPNALPAHAFGRVPVVYLDRYPTARKTYSCVYSDDASCVACAAHELYSLGLKHFAYVPWITRTAYSVARRQAFARLMAGLGGTCVSCTEAEVRNARAFRDFLRALPRPCGILACNDFIARRTVDACAKIGLSVPEDVALVGIDDDPISCEAGNVTLSSVRRDDKGAGAAAARLLAERIAKPYGPHRTFAFGAVELVRRQSTRRFAVRDAICQKGVEFIRLHAAEGISVADVAAAIGLPLRSAQRRFREITGKTIRDEIRDVRFAAAKRRLLDRPTAITGLANLVGYDSDSTLRKLFHARLGTTLHAFRGDSGRAMV